MSVIEACFHIPLFVSEVKDWDIKKDKLIIDDDIQIISRENETNEFIKTDYHSCVGDALNIQSILKDEIEEFCKVLQFQSYSVVKSWTEVQNKEMYHLVHNHGALGYSAVCYVEYDPKHHEPLHFIAPFNNAITGEQIDYAPEGIKESSILFFPSFLLHYAIPNSSTVPRRAVSFNLDVRNHRR